MEKKFHRVHVPSATCRSDIASLHNPTPMIKNYFITALRIMLRQKAYSFLNIAGLSIGIAASLIIILYVADELRYDRFHEGAERIYRIGFAGRLQDTEFNSANSPAPVADAMKKEIPGVEEVVRFGLWRTMPINYKDKSFTEQSFLLADSNFFDFFSFTLVKGDQQTALKGVNKLVITETAASKYFGGEDPIGKIVLGGSHKGTYEVTGIVQDPPHNSHIDFDMILSGQSWDYMYDDQWTSNNLYTYVRLHAGADVEKVREQLKDLVEKNAGAELEKYIGISFKQFVEQGNSFGPFMQPLLDIHLKSDLTDEITPNGNIQYLYIFGAIAIFIILIACINFMNLSTARSANRAKEVGVRKTIGAFRPRLIFQFLSESILYSFFSTLLALVIIAFSLPSFNLIAGKELTPAFLAEPWVIAGILGFTITVGLIAGSYPAFYLTAFKPTEVLKGRLRAGYKNSGLRNILVVVQFIISITLIFGSLVVYQQLKYMQAMNLGFEKENIVSLLHTRSLDKNARAFKNELASHPVFAGASFANRLPPNISWNSAFRKGGSDQDFLLSVYQVDHDHLTTMGYSMAEGRFFSKEFSSDTVAVVVNETAFNVMGFANLDEATILSYNSDPPQPLKVIGIIRDFNFENLRSSVRPMVIQLGPEPNAEMAIRLALGNTSEQIELLEDIWKKYAPDAPFEYSFLDQNFDALFRSEQRMGQIILMFTVLAIGIACLGLFGLATYTAEQRAKEISIRKVMGASVGQVIVLLSKSFVMLVCLAFVIAAPLSWYLANGWLSGFANRISLNAWFVLISGVMAIVIAMATISFQSFKAARENPIDAMRSE